MIRLEGRKDHPITRGALCAKVNDYQERTYSPDRLLHPLRRVGPKGAGSFERVPWDEALDLIADRLHDVIRTDGPEAILALNYLGSMGVVQRRALMRVFNALGASRFHGSVCGAAGNILDAEGHPRGFDPEDQSDARFVLMWGSNLLSTAHHAFHFIDQARKTNGARIVAIDPIRTRTARACDEHVTIRPGTDAALAAGMARVMLHEGLADLGFARTVVEDLDAFFVTVEPWTPERVQAETDVPAATVVRLAREFVAARPALIRCGVAPQQTIRGEETVRALSALAILSGHWKMKGGGLFIEANPALDEPAASRPDLRPSEGRSLDMARLGEHLTNPDLDPPIRALFAWTMNPAVTQPDAGRVRKGLARDDLFTVVIEHFMTDTARYADIVLPSTTQLEHLDILGSWGHHYISLNEPAIPPLGESLSHGEIARRLAARLGLHHPVLRESDEDIAASALPPGVSLQMVREHGFIKSSPGAPRFDRPLRIAGTIDTPARPTPGTYQLLTPKSHFFLNSTFGNMPRQRAAMGRPTLEMHPEDAAQAGLVDAEHVELWNERGRVHAWLKVTDVLHQGVVALAGKWWGEPADTSAVANLLTPSAWAPHGQPAYNDVFVEVRRAGSSEPAPAGP